MSELTLEKLKARLEFIASLQNVYGRELAEGARMALKLDDAILKNIIEWEAQDGHSPDKIPVGN